MHWNGKDWQASIGTAGKVSAMKGRQGGDGMGRELSGGAGVAGTGIAATGPDWYGRAGMDRNARRGRARTGMARIGRQGVERWGTSRRREAGAADEVDRLTLRLALLSCVNG